MGFDPSTFLLQHRIQRYKQVSMKTYEKIERVYRTSLWVCEHDHIPYSGAKTACSVSSALRRL
jgi:hypothetical protein